MNIVPVTVEPKFLPFLYKEFNGKEAEHLGMKMKAIDISRNSVIGKYLRISCEKASVPIIDSKINLYIILQQNLPKGTVYTYNRSEYSFLILPEEIVVDFNKLIHKIFSNSLYFFVNGYIEASEKKYNCIKKAIEKFQLYYELDEVENGFNYKTLERKYFREKKSNTLQKFATKH